MLGADSDENEMENMKPHLKRCKLFPDGTDSSPHTSGEGQTSSTPNLRLTVKPPPPVTVHEQTSTQTVMPTVHLPDSSKDKEQILDDKKEEKYSLNVKDINFGYCLTTPKSRYGKNKRLKLSRKKQKKKRTKIVNVLVLKTVKLSNSYQLRILHGNL